LPLNLKFAFFGDIKMYSLFGVDIFEGIRLWRESQRESFFGTKKKGMD
jgi:hypothetical protein